MKRITCNELIGIYHDAVILFSAIVCLRVLSINCFSNLVGGNVLVGEKCTQYLLTLLIYCS